VAASELDDSRTDGVEYSIVTDSSEDRNVADYFSVELSTGIISTKASLIQFGMYCSIYRLGSHLGWQILGGQQFFQTNKGSYLAVPETGATLGSEMKVKCMALSNQSVIGLV